MTEHTFVADASPLIALTQIDRLHLLHVLSAEIIIPPAVAVEIAPTLPLRPPWIVERPLSRQIDTRIALAELDLGETEVISLGIELGAAGVVLDDRRARRLAEAAGLHVVGTLGVLRLAKRLGLLTVIRPEIEALVAVEFFAGPALIARVLADAGEY